jgi:hypothetical protein
MSAAAIEDVWKIEHGIGQALRLEFVEMSPSGRACARMSRGLRGVWVPRPGSFHPLGVMTHRYRAGSFDLGLETR